jgi:hypothetical protein
MRKNVFFRSKSPARKMYLICFLLLIIVVLFWPFDLTIAPERKFKVVDEKANPVSAAIVQQTWYQYSLQVREEEKIAAGSDGSAVLPKRAVRTRWIDLLCGAVKKIVKYAIHASIGSSDIIIVSAFSYESKSFLDGEGLGNTVILKRK